MDPVDLALGGQPWQSLIEIQESGGGPLPKLHMDHPLSSPTVLGLVGEPWGDYRRECLLGLVAGTRWVFHSFSCIPFGTPFGPDGGHGTSLSSYGSLPMEIYRLTAGSSS